MVNMLCKTKGNADPKGKMRVYFTCHPDDFDKYFDTVCGDILNAVDCAIYYTEDMSSQIPQKHLSTDLGSNNIFVIPVTYKLLSTPNRAMDKDFHYARSENIPVLPIMMGEGIDSIYSSPEKFGEIQYLNPYSSDFTEISYQEKLKKYLNTLFISEELAIRVKAAFAAYIFLSYRKKDRIYANELMRIIHSNPDCRDIAIWFDEFLTPGESFKENINNILSNSKLFAMVVTPNLLEEPDGKANYVMSEEYPYAKKSGINILPMEMEKTNIDELKEKFLDIPECVNPIDNEELLINRLHEILADYINCENNEDKEHIYLIGLAYLYGYDVEVDRTRGVELVTKAADDGLTEAMETLYDMYSNGNFVSLNYTEAIKWAKHLADYYTKEYNDEREMLKLLYQTLRALSSGKIKNELIRYIYELKVLVINGESPEVFRCANCGSDGRTMVFSSTNHGAVCNECKAIAPDGICVSNATWYTLQYIVSSTIEKLYTFTVSDEVLSELQRILRQYTDTHIGRTFKSLEILEMCLK